jgi:hypothetical protein
MPSAEPQNTLSNPSRHLPFIIFYFILAAIYFNRLLFDASSCISDPSTDVLLYFFPVRCFGFSSLSRGVIPLWNPHTFGGTPFQAVPQTALFYPLNFLFLFLPTILAINITAFLHMVLSGCAVYFLARRMKQGAFAAFLSGIAYAFCGQQILRLYAGHLAINAAFPWIPLFLLFVHDLFTSPRFSRIAAASFILALAVLAGQPQYVYYLIIVSFVYWIFFTFTGEKKNASFLKSLGTIRILLVVLIIGILLSSIQVLPSAAFTKESVRSGGLSREEAGSFSLPFKQLASFVAPGIFGSDITRNYTGGDYEWEMTGYCGMVTLLLACFAFLSGKKRIVIFHWVLASIGLILALGKHTPFFHVFYTILPGFRLFRGHAKALILTNLSLAILAGFGLEALVRNYFSTPPRKKIFTCMMLGILILELGVFAFSRRSTIPAQLLESVPSIEKNGQSEPPYERQLTLILGRENSALLSGAFDVSGYDSNQLLRYRNFINSAQGLPLDYNQMHTQIRKLSPGYLVPFGVKHLLVPKKGKVPSWEALALESFEGLSWTRRKIRISPTPDQALSAIIDPNFDFSGELVLETGENPPLPGDKPLIPDRIGIKEWQTNRIAIQAAVETPCYLLVSNVYSKGWKARLDGKPVRLYAANYLFQAIYLPGGNHDISLYYSPFSFKFGAFLSIFSLLGLGVVGMISDKKIP